MQVSVGGGPYALAAGSDGALWVTLVHGGAIARVTVDGDVETFEAGERPSIIAAGPDGALCSRRAGDDRIGRITHGGRAVRVRARRGLGAVRDHRRAGWGIVVHGHRPGRADHGRRRDRRVRAPARVVPGDDHDRARRCAVVHAQPGARDRADRRPRCPDDPRRPDRRLRPGRDRRHRTTRSGSPRSSRGGSGGSPTRRDPGARARRSESKPHAIIAAQSDGVWVSLWGADQIAHVSDEGEIATLDLPPGSEPHGMAIGPDGALWVALEAGSVIRITSYGMRILVTGSSGHLGEALCACSRRRRRRRRARHPPRRRTPTSSARSPIASSCARPSTGVDAVLHAATLHKPHVGSHTRQEFVETNITGTLKLLEEAVAAGVGALRLHQHDERVRPRADAGARRTRGLDHRGRRPRPAQHLRRHQDRGRGRLRARPPRPRAARS